MRLEAHVDQEDQVVHQLAVVGGRMEVALLKLVFYAFFEGLQLEIDELVGVVLLEGDVEEDELVPGGVEQLVQKVVLLRVAPQRNERKVLLACGFLVFLVDDVIDVELMQVFEQFLIGQGLLIFQLSNTSLTILGISAT